MIMSRPVTLFTGQWADLEFEELCALAEKMGYDGLEIACWGGGIDVDRAYEDDAYVIHAIMGYNVSNGRIGFPISSIGKVQNKLEEYKISYQIMDRESITDSNDFKNNNKYDKYYKDGIKSMDKKRSNDELLEKIKNLPDDKVDKIINFINEVIDE